MDGGRRFGSVASFSASQEPRLCARGLACIIKEYKVVYVSSAGGRWCLEIIRKKKKKKRRECWQPNRARMRCDALRSSNDMCSARYFAAMLQCCKPAKTQHADRHCDPPHVDRSDWACVLVV
jgi:hypothetical protein